MTLRPASFGHQSTQWHGHTLQSNHEAAKGETMLALVGCLLTYRVQGLGWVWFLTSEAHIVCAEITRRECTRLFFLSPAGVRGGRAD